MQKSKSVAERIQSNFAMTPLDVYTVQLVGPKIVFPPEALFQVIFMFHFAKKQGRIHGYPSRVRVGRGHI